MGILRRRESTAYIAIMVTIDAARTEWSSADVLSGVTRLAAEGRAVTADLVALLAVLDERRLFEAES